LALSVLAQLLVLALSVLAQLLVLVLVLVLSPALSLVLSLLLVPVLALVLLPALVPVLLLVLLLASVPPLLPIHCRVRPCPRRHCSSLEGGDAAGDGHVSAAATVPAAAAAAPAVAVVAPAAAAAATAVPASAAAVAVAAPRTSVFSISALFKAVLPLAAALRARRRCQRDVGADVGAGCHSRLGDSPRCLHRDHAPNIKAVPGVSPLAGWGSWFRSGLHWGLVMVMMIAGSRGARVVFQCILCDRRNALVCNRSG
jgi:hypothetical protein